MDEKERLIKMFFNIRGNEQTQALKNCQSQCERFLLNEDSEEIKDLVKVINALIIYFETGDKEESKEWVVELWDKLYPKPNLSFYEIRLLNAILFTEEEIDKVIEVIKDCLIQLEIYKFHEIYLDVNMALKLNLVIFLTDSKFFNKQYKVEYDKLILQTTNEIISLNLKSGFNNDMFVSKASIYQGILLKEQNLIYIGFLLLKKSNYNSDQSIEELIKVYTKRYSIKF